MGARNEVKAQETIDQIKKDIPDADIQFLKLDLTSFKSVKSAAEAFKRFVPTVRGESYLMNFDSTESSLHGLVNNAGIMGVPFSNTPDGFEIQFQTNYLSHWLLTSLLLPTLLETSKISEPGSVRIVNLTSDGHQLAPKLGINFDDPGLESQNAMTRYGQSKLANMLHAKELHRRYGPNGSELIDGKGEIWVAAVHPGHIDT
jgi:NAD(P)-dependent dehydrogenase (short-subunit alcohol dehydrogenase family)